MDEQSLCQAVISQRGSSCHGLDFWYGCYLTLGRPLSAPTSLCIQLLQTADPQKVVILCEVPNSLSDSCLSNLCRMRQKISYILNKICAPRSEKNGPVIQCGSRGKQSFKLITNSCFSSSLCLLGPSCQRPSDLISSLITLLASASGKDTSISVSISYTYCQHP